MWVRIRFLNPGSSNSCSEVILTWCQIDARCREATMPQHSLHFRKLCTVFQHATGEAMPQHVRRNLIKLLSEYPQFLGLFKIPLSFGGFTQLGRRGLAQISNALPDHARLDPW